MKLINIVLALLLPPVSAFLSRGFSLQLLLNILLWCLGWLPGSIHAVWLLTQDNK